MCLDSECENWKRYADWYAFLVIMNILNYWHLTKKKCQVDSKVLWLKTKDRRNRFLPQLSTERPKSFVLWVRLSAKHRESVDFAAGCGKTAGVFLTLGGGVEYQHLFLGCEVRSLCPALDSGQLYPATAGLEPPPAGTGTDLMGMAGARIHCWVRIKPLSGHL